MCVFAYGALVWFVCFAITVRHGRERYWPNGSRPGTEWLVGRMVVVKVEVNSRGMKGVGRKENFARPGEDLLGFWMI